MRIYTKRTEVDEEEPNSATCADFGTVGYWTYVAPDGGEHTLFGPSADTYYYTDDGSMIRAKTNLDGTWEVDLPDGRILDLGQYVHPTNGGQVFTEINESTICPYVGIVP